MTIAGRLVRVTPLIVITCVVMGIVLHVSEHGRPYVLAGARPVDVLVELLLALLAAASALLVTATSTRLLGMDGRARR